MPNPGIISRFITKSKEIYSLPGKIASGIHKTRPYQIPHEFIAGRPVTATTKILRPSTRTLHNLFGRRDAYWPGSYYPKDYHDVGKAGQRLDVIFDDVTGLPINPPRTSIKTVPYSDMHPYGLQTSGELVNIPWRNAGDDLVDKLIDGITHSHDDIRTIVNPAVSQARMLRKSAGKDAVHLSIQAHGGKDIEAYNALLKKLNPAQMQRLRSFEGAYEGMLTPIRGYLKKKGLPHYEKGKYIPESLAEYYKVLVPRNLDELVRANRAIKASDITTHGMEVKSSFGTYNLAHGFMDDNALINRAVIWPESYISPRIQHAFANEEFAGWMVNIAHGKVNPNLISEGVHASIRNIIEQSLKRGIGGSKMPFAAGFLPKKGMVPTKIYHTPESLDQYGRSMYRKIWMDEPAEHWGYMMKRDVMFTSNPEYKRYAEDILNRALGVPSPTINWLANHLVSFGIDEKKLRGLFANAMQVQAMLKIGANPLLPILNATQLWVNTGALLGYRTVVDAYAMFLANAQIGDIRMVDGIMRRMTAREWIKYGGYTYTHVGPDVPKILAGMQNVSNLTLMSKVNNIMLKPFTAVEMNHNRGISFVAGLLKGTKMGLTGDELVKFAEGVVKITQFPYGAASQPWIFGPVSNVPLQFKTYFVHQIDFLTQLTKMAIQGARTGEVELAYPLLRSMSAYGVLGGIGALPFNDYFMERSKTLNEYAIKYPTAFRGAPGLLGYDISRRLDLQFPDPAGNWLSFFIGPTLSDLKNLVSATPELMKGRFGEMSERALRGISPAVSSARGSLGRDGTGMFKMDSSGRIIARYKNTGEAVAGMFGFRSTAVYKQERASDIIRMYEYAYTSSRKYYVGKIVQAKQRGDMRRAAELIQEANSTPIPGASKIWRSHFITPGDIKRAEGRFNKQLSERGISDLHRREISLAIPDAFGE
jgi:hypothetical protein